MIPQPCRNRSRPLPFDCHGRICETGGEAEFLRRVFGAVSRPVPSCGASPSAGQFPQAGFPAIDPRSYRGAAIFPNNRRALLAFLHDVAMAAFSLVVSLYLRLGGDIADYE